MRLLTPAQAKKIILECETSDPETVKRIINEYISKHFIFRSIELNKEEFNDLVYDRDLAKEYLQSNDLSHLEKVAGGYLEKRDSIDFKTRHRHIEDLIGHIKKEGYDPKSYLTLRELYLPEDPEGSYYIDNGLHRALAFAVLLLNGEREYTKVPAVLAIKP